MDTKDIVIISVIGLSLLINPFVSWLNSRLYKQKSDPPRSIQTAPVRRWNAQSSESAGRAPSRGSPRGRGRQSAAGHTR